MSSLKCFILVTLKQLKSDSQARVGTFQPSDIFSLLITRMYVLLSEGKQDWNFQKFSSTPFHK